MLFQYLLLAVLLATSSNTCFALRELHPLSPKEAREMGVALRTMPAGPEALWLELEFKTEGALKAYSPERNSSRVELELRDGSKTLICYVILQEQHPKPGQVLVRFMANHGCLDKVFLTIVVGDGLLPGGAYELRAKELIDAAMTH